MAGPRPSCAPNENGIAGHQFYSRGSLHQPLASSAGRAIRRGFAAILSLSPHLFAGRRLGFPEEIRIVETCFFYGNAAHGNFAHGNPRQLCSRQL